MLKTIIDIFKPENKETNVYEVERKFLLKSIPVDLEMSKFSRIKQYYVDIKDGVSERVREINSHLGEERGKTKYIKTNKIRKNELANQEIEVSINKISFDIFRNKSRYFIGKDRHYYVSDGYRWEIDIFRSINLIMAEVELISTEENLEDTMAELRSIKIPKSISDVLIMEVTDIKSFSNKRLATKIKI